MDEQVIELSKHQVWDAGRGCFFVKLEPTRQRYKGTVVYKDAFGKRIAIVGTVVDSEEDAWSS